MDSRTRSIESGAIGNIQALASDIQEGDWTAYKQRLAEASTQNQALLESYGGIFAYRRRCALAYLGKRAQLHAGVCCRTRPRILTSAFLATIEDANRIQRFKRYPWLETLLKLLAEIERIQDEVASDSVTIQALRVRQNWISVEGAAQHFQHAMSLLAQRVQA